MPAARMIYRKNYPSVTPDFMAEMLGLGEPSRVLDIPDGVCDIGVCPNTARKRVVFFGRIEYGLCAPHFAEWQERRKG